MLTFSLYIVSIKVAGSGREERLIKTCSVLIVH